MDKGTLNSARKTDSAIKTKIVVMYSNIWQWAPVREGTALCLEYNLHMYIHVHVQVYMPVILSIHVHTQ